MGRMVGFEWSAWHDMAWRTRKVVGADQEKEFRDLEENLICQSPLGASIVAMGPSNLHVVSVGRAVGATTWLQSAMRK